VTNGLIQAPHFIITGAKEAKTPQEINLVAKSSRKDLQKECRLKMISILLDKVDPE